MYIRWDELNFHDVDQYTSPSTHTFSLCVSLTWFSLSYRLIDVRVSEVPHSRITANVAAALRARPHLRAALCGVAIMGPGVCSEEPFDPDAIDAWRSKSRQLLEDPALRLSHAEAWSTWLAKRHDPRTIAQRLLGGLPLLQPKMN